MLGSASTSHRTCWVCSRNVRSRSSMLSLFAVAKDEVFIFSLCEMKFA